jgi:hypothetical protein
MIFDSCRSLGPYSLCTPPSLGQFCDNAYNGWMFWNRPQRPMASIEVVLSVLYNKTLSQTVATNFRIHIPQRESEL